MRLKNLHCRQSKTKKAGIKRVSGIRKALTDIEIELTAKGAKKSRDEHRTGASSVMSQDILTLMSYKKQIMEGLKEALAKYVGILRDRRYKLDDEIKKLGGRSKSQKSEEVIFADQAQKDKIRLENLRKERERVSQKASSLKDWWDEVVVDLAKFQKR